MFRNRRTMIIATTCLTLLAAAMLLTVGASADSDWLKGSPQQQLKTLADIQPGLGTIMIEYSRRYTTAYYAAKDGNWPLADYQIKEALEIQEVGEATRPGRAAGLKGFEKAYMEPLQAAIKTKDLQKFDAAFQKGIKGCNGCHAASGFPFIKYQLPNVSPSPLEGGR